MAHNTDEMLALQAPYHTVGEFFDAPEFPRWYAHYFTIMVRYVRHLFGFDLPTAEDITQQGFLHLVAHKRDLPLIAGLSVGHLLRYNVRWYAVHRFDQRHHPTLGAISLNAPELQSRSGDTPFVETLVDPAPLLEEQIATQETLTEAMATIQALPGLQREMLAMAAMGFSGKEVLMQIQARYPDLSKRQLHSALASARWHVRAKSQVQRSRQGQHALFQCRVCRREGGNHAGKQMCPTCYKRFVRFQRVLARQGATDLTPSAMLDAFLRALVQPASPFRCKLCGQTDSPHKAKGMCDPCYRRFRSWQKAQSSGRDRRSRLISVGPVRAEDGSSAV